ncbi:hypothetical protein BH18ACT15_BH18ACT15_14290 [soil metagenome]
MSAERTCDYCDTPLGGRRPDARFCSPACRRAAARRREARRAPLAAVPVEKPYEDTARRAHACEAALRRLERRLDELARHLSDADARVMARVMRDSLREDEKAG